MAALLYSKMAALLFTVQLITGSLSHTNTQIPSRGSHYLPIFRTAKSADTYVNSNTPVDERTKRSKKKKELIAARSW